MAVVLYVKFVLQKKRQQRFILTLELIYDLSYVKKRRCGENKTRECVPMRDMSRKHPQSVVACTWYTGTLCLPSLLFTCLPVTSKQTIKATSPLGDPRVTYNLEDGMVPETNMPVRFYLTPNREDGSASILVAEPLDYETTRNFMLRVRAQNVAAVPLAAFTVVYVNVTGESYLFFLHSTRICVEIVRWISPPNVTSSLTLSSQ